MKQVKRQGIWVSVIVVLITGGLALYVPTQLDPSAQVPVHWGPDGADRFADAATAATYLWIMPIVTILTAVLFVSVPFFEPLRDNLERSAKAYGAVWVSSTLLLCLVQFGIAGGMLGWIDDGPQMVRLVIAGSAIMFVLIGNYLPKTRPSFFFGIRTPWTLTSDTSWEKTHRLGGRLFMVAGLVGGLAAFIMDGLVLAFVLPGLLLPMLIILTIYSFFVWRTADDRTTTSDYIV